MKKKNVIILFCIISTYAFGAYLKNVPTTLTQPNGTVINCFATGDEFYNWVHDKEGYTIIQAPNGYYYYAEQDGDLIKASPYLVNSVDPSSVGLIKSIKISQKEFTRKLDARSKSRSAYDTNPSYAPHSGLINNLVVYIRFADDPEFTTTRQFYENNLNTSGVSLKSYFSEVSYNKLNINSTHYPACSLNSNLSYQDSHIRKYFQPYNETTNPIGYTDDEGTREQTLLEDAITWINTHSPVPSNLNIDGDGDGKVDNVCFIIKGNSGDWAELLWGHMSGLYSQNVFINGKRVYLYTFQPENQANVRTLCHEMFHVLGSPDLYHYQNQGELSPVGNWDLMEYGSGHMTAYMKWKYTNNTWISSIPEITSTGTYTLNPLTSATNNCYKIASPCSKDEFLIVEYRKKTGTFETNIPGSGLIVYRIDSRETGNASGPPDEVYIYRPGGTLTNDGDSWNAFFSSSVSRTSINDNTNPSSFLQDGSASGIQISNVTSPDATISFNVSFSPAIIKYSSYKIIDGSSFGNGNGIIEPSETIELPITVKNFGSGNANNVSALLTCLDPDITITNNTQNLSIIKADSLKTFAAFKFNVSSSCIEKNVSFTLRINSNEGVWIQNFSLPVYKIKNINVSVAGKLSTFLTNTEKKTITCLAITGQIDARDFKFMRDSIPTLSALDLSGSTIVAYTGKDGTASTNSTSYPVNTIPQDAFFALQTLTSINIPASVTSIGSYAFSFCIGLNSITVNSRPIDLSLSSNMFYYVNKSTCILYVPYGTKTLYTSANQWSDFTNIVENAQGFLLSANTVKLAAANGSNVTINITGNVTWNASSDQTWLSVSPTSATGNKTITLTAQANQTKITRTAIITISSTGVASQTITVTQSAPVLNVTAGGLSSVLSSTDLNQISDLALSGTIDARDFKTMRDNMPLLANLDLSGVTIVAYNGVLGIKALNTLALDSIETSEMDNPLNLKHELPLKIEANRTAAATYPANEIPESAFYNKTTLLSFVLPNNVSLIGRYAFYYCNKLSSVTIPASVSSIGIRAFGNCSKLTELIVQATNPNYSSQNGVLFNKNATLLMQYPGGKQGSYTIPSSVSTIGESAFEGCMNLTSVSIPNSVTTIGNSAFWNCNGLNTVTIPSSVTTIGDYAYAYCFGLMGNLSIPASVTSIGINAFVGSSEEFFVVTSNPNYFSLNGILFNKNLTLLIQCPGLKQGSYTIPSSVTSIGSGAFGYCTGLTSITIPSSVSSIGNSAFGYCTGLTSIYANPVAPVDLTNKSYVFYNINKSTCTLYVPLGSKSAYQAANQWTDFTNIVELATATPTIENDKISVYLNPIDETIRIKGIEGTYMAFLFDINGRVLINKQINENGLISITSYPKGVYIIKLITEKGNFERKLIKR